jgi:hypothetical protein
MRWRGAKRPGFWRNSVEACDTTAGAAAFCAVGCQNDGERASRCRIIHRRPAERREAGTAFSQGLRLLQPRDVIFMKEAGILFLLDRLVDAMSAGENGFLTAGEPNIGKALS